MTSLEFTQQLLDLWPKTNQAVVSKIEAKLNYYNQKDIHELWKWTEEHYNQQSPPSYAHICGYIVDCGIHQTKFLSHKRHYVFICLNCGEVYADKQQPLIALCCPVCLSEDRTVQEYDNQKHQVTTTQYKCFTNNPDKQHKPFKCLMYGQSGSYGPMCKSWSIQQNTPECKDCICIDCCRKLIAENKTAYQREKSFDAKKLADSKRMD